MQLDGRPDSQNLRLVGVELQAVLLDVSGTRSENGEALGGVVGLHRRMQLRVVGVLVVLDAILRDDVSHWTAVHGEQQLAKYRPLWNADVELDCVLRWHIWATHILKLWSDSET